MFVSDVAAETLLVSCPEPVEIKLVIDDACFLISTMSLQIVLFFMLPLL